MGLIVDEGYDKTETSFATCECASASKQQQEMGDEYHKPGNKAENRGKEEEK
jgi:hypothetical protein